MDKEKAQFFILKNVSAAGEVSQDVVNKALGEIEEESEKNRVRQWITNNGIRVRAKMERGAFGAMSEKTVALVRDKNSDRNLAVFGHDAGNGRVIGRISDPILQKLFDRYVDQSIVVYMTESVNGARLMRRRKIVPKDEDYLKHLLSKFVIVPHDVRWLKRISATELLDGLVDKIYTEEVITNGV